MTQSIFRHIAKRKKFYLSLYFLATFHLIGIAGISHEATRELFLRLTPASLLLSASIVAWNHSGWNIAFLQFILFSYSTGLAVEIIGVNTGFPFGVYSYGSSLGPKVFNTPLVIGLNWSLLIYCTGVTVRKVFHGTIPQIITGAALMTFIDLWMEPVAPKVDFWTFAGGTAPLANYAGWFGVSIVLHALFFKMNFEKSNKIALTYPVVLVLFFISLQALL